ncbi:monooxygenase [Pragia fontium]|uniref:Mono-oxygenase ydhR n=2 Tax=Pragia fontium TaxID=82985 RepID=A0AAJ4W9A5_9GAMM|nr:monooxygenase [Pragia fontium]AKJ42000.1 monooxygenase [Pragia fontium]SFC44819.1 Putative mono-oxygenase ydhR [Pragia fontium DSM 5563 = ATCC 49100]SUB82231.1 Putative monooxygenase ydhR [Pragia fontium]VEJ54994.1 Putative monooxygenase ydhR [Pragia fontium]GKX61971.1 monooxygenase [Pragia fontium]
MAVLLQVDFSMPAEMLGENLSKSAIGLAESITQEPGFISKIWTENLQTEEAGGIYLFTDRASAERYWEMHQKRIASFGVKNANGKIFDINLPLTKITRGHIS